MVCLCAGTGWDLAVAPIPRPPAPPRKEEDTGPEATTGEALALAMSLPEVGGRTVRSSLSRPVLAGRGGAAEETEGSMPLLAKVVRVAE